MVLFLREASVSLTPRHKHIRVALQIAASAPALLTASTDARALQMHPTNLNTTKMLHLTSLATKLDSNRPLLFPALSPVGIGV
jgi:hypothetical protein